MDGRRKIVTVTAGFSTNFVRHKIEVRNSDVAMVGVYFVQLHLINVT